MNGEDDNKNQDSALQNGNRALRLKVESNIVQRFMNAMEVRMNQLEVTNTQDFKLSPHERKVLMDVCTANLFEGVAAGLVTFFVLRRLHYEYFRYLKRGYDSGRSSMPNAFNSPYQQVPRNRPEINVTNTVENTKSISRLSTPQSGSTSTGSTSAFGSTRWLFQATSFIFDGIVSLYVAIYVSTRNPDQFLQQISDIPLMEGTSVVSKELCPILLEEIQRLQNDLAHNDENTSTGTQLNKALPKISPKNKVLFRDAMNHPETPVLQCLLQFCTNCRRRSAYEQILREQSGSDEATAISIPPPGVPTTLDISNDVYNSDTDTVLSDMEHTLYNDDDGNNISTRDETNWTDPFVTDQEEHRRRK
jgi:hypothetical protein